VIPDRDKRAAATKHAARVIIAAVVLFPAVDAGAQKGNRQNLGGGNDDQVTVQVTDSTRLAIEDARSHLRSALASDQDYVRWEALRGARNLHEDWIAEVVLPLCESPNLTERVLALEALVATDPNQGRDLFLTLLQHRQRSVRLRALLGLEKLGDPDVAPEIIRVLEDDPDVDLRVVAARALGNIGNPEASAALRRKITSHHDALREQSVFSLLKLGDERLTESLLRQLENNRDLDITASMKLLALIPDPSLIGRISHHLDSEDEAVRTQASITILSILERSRTGAP
jgi:HEAT repeat protein